MPIPRANLLSWHSNLLPTTAHDQLGRGKMPLLSSCDENSRTKLLNVVGRGVHSFTTEHRVAEDWFCHARIEEDYPLKTMQTWHVYIRCSVQ